MSTGCQGPVSQSKEDGLTSIRRDSLLTSRRFAARQKLAPLPALQTDLRGLNENLALDGALKGRLINHYERDVEVWRVGPSIERKQEGLFEMGPEKGSDDLQIFIDLNP
jgi:hypothetical protein